MRQVLLFLGVCVLTFNGVGQSPGSAKIDSLVQRTMHAFDVPGIAVAILKDGKIIHSRGYGVRSLNTKEKVDENTLFAIASNTKAFTTTAIGMLVDQGKIKWDDKVIKYIPEFQLYHPYVTSEFTIRDLLTHRSGLGLGAGDLMFYPDSSDFTIKDVIHNLRFLKPVSGFRAKYDYDNTLYIVAGEVITRVSGLSWDVFVEQNILNPLEMTRSACSFDRLKDKSNVSDPHVLIDRMVQVAGRHRSTYSRASGSMYSSIEDLSKWVMLQLRDGQFADTSRKPLVSKKVHDELWSPQTIIPVRNPGNYNTHFSAYGLGFGITDVKGLRQINHTGGAVGMVTQVTMIPELQLGIIVLTNQEEGGAFQAIADQVKDHYLQINGTDRVKEYSARSQPGVPQVDEYIETAWKRVEEQKTATDKPDLAKYTGTYRDDWFGDVVISIQDKKLWFASKRSPKLSGEMFCYKKDGFIVKWANRSFNADAYVNFGDLKNGKATAIKMYALSPSTDFSYDFHDLDLHR